jgi:hypothetical protein
MEEFAEDPYMRILMSADVHSWNTSIIYTLQNFFFVRKNLTIMRNTLYKVIFNDKSDLPYLNCISQKISGKPLFLQNCFIKLQRTYPKQKFHYILIDSHSNSEMQRINLHIKSKIFPDQNNKIYPIIFLL